MADFQLGQRGSSARRLDRSSRPGARSAAHGGELHSCCNGRLWHGRIHINASLTHRIGWAPALVSAKARRDSERYPDQSSLGAAKQFGFDRAWRGSDAAPRACRAVRFKTSLRPWRSVSDIRTLLCDAVRAITIARIKQAKRLVYPQGARSALRGSTLHTYLSEQHIVGVSSLLSHPANVLASSVILAGNA